MTSSVERPPQALTPERITFDALWLRADMAQRTAGLTPGRTLRPGPRLRRLLSEGGGAPGDGDLNEGAARALAVAEAEGEGELLSDAALVETLTPPPNETEGALAPDPALAARLQTLPRLLRADSGDAPPELALGVTLGEGGMGVVRQARQLALGREVAVKSLRPEARHPAAMRRLLAEAMVAGQLEHPEILPIHALGRDEDGAPLLVLKRVDGLSWTEVAREPNHALLEGQEPIVWHLQVLMRVCRAVHFAHGKGILHRDLKTDNVMIGRHGEVYVLDWGIAVALHDDGSGAIPLARDADELVGTPTAIAPEMVQAKGALLSPRTDVYLRGAMLHELLTGRPRHEGTEVASVLFAAFISAPYAYPPAVPQELAQIANRACARDPEARFGSADALRLALHGYLEHRASTVLVQSAEARLGDFSDALLHARASLASAVAAEREAALASRRRVPDATEATLAVLPRPEVAAVRLDVEGLASAARASLQEAVRAWADNPAVPRLERRLRLAEAGWQLDCLDVAAAEASLRGLEGTEATGLLDGLQRARQARQVWQERQQRERDDGDPTIGARTRTFFAAVIGVWFSLTPAVGAVARDFYGWRPTFGMHLSAGIVFLGLVGVGAIWARQTMRRTRLNRSVLRTGAVCALAVTFERVVAAMLGMSFDAMVALDQFTFGLTIALMAAGAWPRLWLASLVYFTGAWVASVFPEASLWTLSAATLTSMTLVAFQWRPADYATNRVVQIAARRVLPDCDVQDQPPSP